MEHKEFKRIYHNKGQFSDYNFSSNMFDLNLVIYKNLKNQQDTKVDLNIKIQNLAELGLLNDYKYPFFYLSDSRNFNKISTDDNFLKGIYETILLQKSGRNNKKSCSSVSHKLFLIYRHYLPRNCLSIESPALEYYNKNKRAIDAFSSLKLDPLLNENEYQSSPDWFVYDDESMEYLMKIENTEFESAKNIISTKEEVYYQDKLPYITLSCKEYKHIFVRIIYDADVI
jgi:hypothetical protein